MSYRYHCPAIERLSRIPLLGSCSRKQLVEILRLGTELTVDAGRVLQHEGATASAFYAIETGAAAVSVGGRPVGHLRDGDVFGAPGLLEGHSSETTVTAAVRTDVVVFTRKEFRALLDIVPGTRLIQPAPVLDMGPPERELVHAEPALPVTAGEPCPPLLPDLVLDQVGSR
jgi:hypothetical protein